MLLPKTGLQFMNAVTHEGKVVVVATDAAGHLWYTVKQDGFEDSYLGTDPAKRTGWESWSPLDLPDENDDLSVVANEEATLTRQVAPLTMLMRSVYKSKDLGAPAPVQLVSGQGHLYVFRQSRRDGSPTGTLLCDRFVLDGMTNKLGRKLEVRFKRSRKRLTPYDAGKKSALAADALDFRDTNGNFFYEPTTELCLVDGIANGWFSVVRVPTGEHDKFRWLIFTADAKKVDVVSIRASDEGLFDLRDDIALEPSPVEGQPPVPRSIPGILRRTLKVPGSAITGAPAATIYDLQQERMVGSGPDTQLLRTETRLMLVVPVSKGTAAYSFAIATDGTLSEIAAPGVPSVLRSTQRSLLLPLDTLDQIKLIGDTTPLPQGTIQGVRLGTEQDNADGKVIVRSDQAATLVSGDDIEIRGTSHYNGLYTVSVADEDSFTIEAQFVDSEMGVWEKREKTAEGLVFDGMVTAYEKTPGGKLRVSARSHGLVNGDSVQVVGTRACDGTFPVTRIDDQTFVIESRWAAGEAINVRLEGLKRRGLTLDGQDDQVELPPEAFPAGKELTICVWARGGKALPNGATLLEAVDKDGKRVALISLPSAAGQVSFECGNGTDGCDLVAKAAQPAEVKTEWAHWAFTRKGTGDLAIYRNGALWASATGSRAIGSAKQLRLGAPIVPSAQKKRYEGTLADLAIYGRALTADEIRTRMHITLSGQEPGLTGYWRLGGVVEGDTRLVTDLSLNGYDGTVIGGAAAGAVTFDRKLRDGKTLAVRYTNPELIAVTQRGTYIEEFEFRVTAAGKPLSKAALTKVDKTGKPVFQFRHWGKRSRSADEIIELKPQPATDPFQDADGDWLRASCRVTIPDGVALLRSFEVASVQGTWDTLEIRKHGMRLISDAITESVAADSPTLTTLADAGAAMDAKLADVAANELSEAQLFTEKLAIESKIALLADAEFLKIERDAAVKEVDALTIEVATLKARYEAEKNDTFNYVCKLLLAGTTDKWLHLEGGTDRVMVYGEGVDFMFFRAGSNYHIKTTGRDVYLMGIFSRPVAFPGQFRPWTMVPAGEGYMLQDAAGGQFLHCEGTTNNLVMWGNGHVWKFVRVAHSNDNIQLAKNAWDAKQAALTATQARLDALNALLDPNAPQRPELELQLKAKVTALVAVQATLATANAAYLDGVKSLQRGALSMPDLATDARGLVTRGALLGFVSPASRLSILETCEGNVQLSYVDAASRLRVTNYDAAADSRNATFEQWITDAGRACLCLSKPGSAAALTSGVQLEDAWSVEAWVAAPLPTWEWVVLAGPADRKNAPILVHCGADLGLRCEGRFFSCGFRLDTLPVGWHHVTAVGQRAGKSASVTYYVDGEKVGAPVSPQFGAVSLDGVNDAVELQPVSFPQGAEITVGLWTRSNMQGNQAAVVLDAADAQHRPLIRISALEGGASLAFECGVDGGGADRVACGAPPAESQGGWTHWAFTKNVNTGVMRIYRNGRLWARETGKKKPLSAVSKATLGKEALQDKSFYCGDISDLCVWNHELSATEIKAAMGRPVSTDDPSLFGCWKFERNGEEARARDYSKLARHGTLLGGPSILVIAPPAKIAVDRVGDALNLPLPAPPIPPPPPPPPPRGPLQALSLDGVDDLVTLPAAAIPVGNEITICVWAKGGPSLPRFNALIEALDANNSRVLGVQMTWNDEVVYWDCGSDRLQKKATSAEYRGVWAHWAFTKNAATGQMKIFRNGVLWHSGTGFTKPIPASCAVTVGRMVREERYYAGDIAELSIWNKALTPTEISGVQDRFLVGNEPGLVGYWAFAATAAIDYTANRRDGAYTGSPVISPAAPMPQPQALVFDGVDDNVVIPAMTIDYAPGLTVEAWVFFSQYKAYSRIIDFGNGEANDNILLYNNANTDTLVLGVFRGNSSNFVEVPKALELGKWLHLAATIDAKGHATIYKNGELVASQACQLPLPVKRNKNYIGTTNWGGYKEYFCGMIAEVRLWNTGRTQADIQATMSQRLAGTEPGLVGCWTFGATTAADASTGKRNGTYTGKPALAVLVPQLAPAPASAGPGPFTPLPTSPALKLSELRLWGTALSDDEIMVNSKTLLSGNEPALLAYLPGNEATGLEVRDATGLGHGATLDAAIRWACAAPIGYLGGPRDSVVCAEYSSVTIDPMTQQKMAIMRRFFGSATGAGVVLLADKRVEELALVWVGNAQFAPTLLGYIEGAPPIPSENLTENPSYNGATSVELVTSEDVEFRWNRNQERGAGMSLDGFGGVEKEIKAVTPAGTIEEIGDIRAGVKVNFNLNKTWQAETNITTRSSNRMTDRLELRGTPEQSPKFPQLGARFIPKNVGYALVISGTADMFVTRLMRSGKMIGYQLSPIEGVPPDVNTITFLMNPAYVMQGSLDGLTGTSATSERFHRHVPAMRAQYGGLYPASYYRLKEAYALKQQIENDDKRRESFFAQFSTSGTTAASMEDQIDAAQAPQEIDVDDEASKEQQQKNNKAALKEKQAEIGKMISDPSKRAHAESCFEGWQRKMEKLQVIAGKRNIVNTYVWDADGGLRTESQSFASTAEHTIGGSFSVGGGVGFDGNLGIGSAKFELNAMANGSLTQTMNKTQSTTNGIELNVDLSGVESTGVTNHDDLPILPGEKVDRYRFMTFYLEGSTKNFNDFWSHVVDPEWLQSNGEESRALRQAMGKANKTWRVLHRVTYVERPALRGFGQDVREAGQLDAATQRILNYFDYLDVKHAELKSMLTELMIQIKSR